MQVHGMSDRCRIDNPPMNRFTSCVSETFGFGPGLSVDGEYEAFTAGAFVPVYDDEDAIVISRAGRVNNECTGEESLLTLAFLRAVEVSAGSSCPVHVRASVARIELHFTGFSCVQPYSLVGIAGMGMQPIDLCGQR